MSEDVPDIPESDEVKGEGHARNQQRLAEYLAGHYAAEDSIDLKAAVSEARSDGAPDSAIFADFGGREEIIRRIGEEEFEKIFGETGAAH